MSLIQLLETREVKIIDEANKAPSLDLSALFKGTQGN